MIATQTNIRAVRQPAARSGSRPLVRPASQPASIIIVVIIIILTIIIIIIVITSKFTITIIKPASSQGARERKRAGISARAGHTMPRMTQALEEQSAILYHDIVYYMMLFYHIMLYYLSLSLYIYIYIYTYIMHA